MVSIILSFQLHRVLESFCNKSTGQAAQIGLFIKDITLELFFNSNYNKTLIIHVVN